MEGLSGGLSKRITNLFSTAKNNIKNGEKRSLHYLFENFLA